jgi:general secretion pathway protein I
MIRIGPRLHAERGFTLLEAIVALAVIALALIPLISYIAQAADAFRRAGESNDRSMAMQAALALMDPVNPMEEPQGRLNIDNDVSVEWHSDVAVPPNTGVLVGGGLANFRVGFYDVHVTLSRTDEPAWFSFDLRKAGYERISSGFPLGGGPPVAGAP